MEKAPRPLPNVGQDDYYTIARFFDMEKVPRPLPNVDRPETRPFWEGCKRRELLLQRCRRCKTYIWYPQEVCHNCNSWELEWHKVSGRGKVFTWTVLRRPLHPYFKDKLPLVVALVEPEEAPGVRLTTNIVDCAIEDVYIGMPVEVVFEDVSQRVTLPLFRPVHKA